jgi:VWFA-related protein
MTRDMRRSFVLSLLLVLALFVAAFRGFSQTSASTLPSEEQYRFNIPVDEVILTFHAADAHGLSVNDLKIDELRLLDKGNPPRRILDFKAEQNLPIRAGILMDSSESMIRNLPIDRAIAIKYAQSLLRQQSDQALVMSFGFISKIVQPWTSDSISLSNGVRGVVSGRENPLGGTAIFDTLFRACLYEFGKMDHSASGNFILLFSDGEDNASHTSLEEAVDACQQSNTAVYAFRAEPVSGPSTGPKNLTELADETGGRVFHDDESETEIANDLRIIDADLRNQYRLIYKPAELKHDGSFHRIELQAPDRVNSIVVRTGYYAPAR